MSIFGETTATCFCTWPKRSPSVTVHSLRRTGRDWVRKSRMQDSPFITHRPLEKFSTSKPARMSRCGGFFLLRQDRGPRSDRRQARQAIDFPQPGRDRRCGAIAHAELGFQMLERAFQREFEGCRRRDEMECFQPGILREVQPFLPGVEVIEKPEGRDFDGFPLGEFAPGPRPDPPESSPRPPGRPSPHRSARRSRRFRSTGRNRDRARAGSRSARWSALC